VTVLFSGIVGALITLAITASFHYWKLHRDELNARCDDLCRVILEAAGAASAYWADDYSMGTKSIKEMRVTEARIRGLQTLFEGLYGELKVRLEVDETEKIDHLMSSLVDSVSGGDFTVEGRAADPIRTQAAPQAASEVVVAIRRAHRTTIPFSALSRIYDENRRRKLDMPRGWKGS
jgi:hypothetical protein